MPEIKNLKKAYGNYHALNGLDMSIPEGSLFGLVGPNGAGKTTTIKMLSCLIKPSKGDAEVLGHSIRDDADKIKAKIGLSPQETAIAPNLTVRENLEFVCGIYGFDRKSAKEKTERMLRELSLSEIAEQRAKTLSGGWQRRLSIAMALISEPELLFLDEPTLGLDVLARRELWSVIRKLKGKMTVILTTHYLEEAEALSDRLGIMAKGRLVACGTASELKALAGCDSFEDAFVKLCGGETV